MAPSYELYLIRHGLAEERGEAWPDDRKRPLTVRGVSRLQRSAHALATLGVTFDLVLTSSLVRARQTAEAIASECNPRPRVVNADSLAPGGTCQAVLADLARHAARKRIALVGHEPGIGELASLLIGAQHAIEFKKGAICRIDVDALPPEAPGSLRWLLTPKLLRGLRRE